MASCPVRIKLAGEQRFCVLLGVDGGAHLGLPSVAARPQAPVERVLDGLNPAFCFFYAFEGRQSVPSA